MDLVKAKIFLEKINSLYSNMAADRKNISTIERDLMKSYVQQLYECFLHIEEAPNRPAVEVIKSMPKSTPEKTVDADKKEPPVPIRETVIVERHPQPAPVPPTPVAAPRPEPIKTEAPVPLPPKPEPVKTEAPAPICPDPPRPAPSAQPAPQEPIRPFQPTFNATPELEDLFSFATAKELSEKLSEMPIADIKKAMGLNERILTQNELFGGDQAVFDLTLDTLNKLPDFQQAKSFLMRNAASKYNWTHKDKVAKAKTFIKLIKRRYV